MWKLYAVLAAVFAALTAVFAKIGVRDVNSSLATAIRTAVVLVLTWGIVLATGHLREVREVGGRTWLWLVLSGAATGLSWLFYFRAIQEGPVSRVAPVDKLSVVFVVIIACIFLGEQLTWRVALGCVLIAAGSLLMLAR